MAAHLLSKCAAHLLFIIEVLDFTCWIWQYTGATKYFSAIFIASYQLSNIRWWLDYCQCTFSAVQWPVTSWNCSNMQCMCDRYWITWQPILFVLGLELLTFVMFADYCLFWLIGKEITMLKIFLISWVYFVCKELLTKSKAFKPLSCSHSQHRLQRQIQQVDCLPHQQKRLPATQVTLPLWHYSIMSDKTEHL